MEISMLVLALVVVGIAAFFIGKKSVNIPDRSEEIGQKDARIDDLLVQVRELTSQRDVSRANEENAIRQLEAAGEAARKQLAEVKEAAEKQLAEAKETYENQLAEVKESARK